MCIACELGYWSMVDALEAEQNASKKSVAVEDPSFACEPSSQVAASTPAPPTQRTVDESAS